MSVLELDRVSYRYPGTPRPALDDISLAVEPGEVVMVAGASGSGKSTLLGAAAGLIPHFHGGELTGRVTVAGMDSSDHGPGELAAAVGTLFQDPETQIVMGTVRAELAFPLENRGQPAAAVARGIEEAALALGIGHLLDRATAELSGGELQRVALGAALAGRPSLLVLDEPTSQLDPVVGDELIGLLRRLNEDAETTVLLAEHRLERCLAAADRVIVLDGGRIVCDAPPTAFLEWASACAPELQTPGARLLDGLGLPPAPSVKGARAALRVGGLLPEPNATAAPHSDGRRPEPTRQPRASWISKRRGRRGSEPQLELRDVWHELPDGPAILRGASLTIGLRGRVALMGRNGAGKSTLLKHAAGLIPPTRGRVRSAGRVALLLQNPTDYLVHETVEQEASAASLALVRLDAGALKGRHPRDLSGGEKQRLALAIVLGDPNAPPAVLCLDEPTRGMDRGAKEQLARLLLSLGTAVLVATHDTEFAAAFAERVILLADGAPIADGPAAEVLSGGTYFATETARILDGAALRPADGVELLRRTEVPA